MISITLVIIILTAIISFTALSNQKITDDLIFYPPAISSNNQWYRFLSCALIHADIMHLVFNMWALYMFGEVLEGAFKNLFPGMGGTLYLCLYIFSQFLCLLPTYLKHKDNYYYKSLGASGAVSAVVFASIFLVPTASLRLLFLPIDIPGFIFGGIYLGVSYYLSRRGADNINHDAHFWGALSGIMFFIIFCFLFSVFNPVTNFIYQVRGYFG